MPDGTVCMGAEADGVLMPLILFNRLVFLFPSPVLSCDACTD
jgi:hypothetical protein